MKKKFVMLWPDGHHYHEFSHLWCAAPLGAQESLVEASPERFFGPPYVGSRGWLGVRRDRRVGWDQTAALCENAYRIVAPERLIDQLDAAASRPTYST